MEQDVGSATKRYGSIQQVADIMHVARTTIERSIDNKTMIRPDVLVLPNGMGWDLERVRRFAVASERIDDSGRPIRMAARERAKTADHIRSLVAGEYKVVTRLYLGTVACSRAYNQGAMTVYFKRGRNRFIPADVLVGKTTYGWLEQRVLRHAREEGMMPQAALDLWAIRRTVEYGMPTDTRWVRENFATRPQMLAELDLADEQRAPLPKSVDEVA